MIGPHGGIAAVVALMADGFVRWLAGLVLPSETVKRGVYGKLKPQGCDPCGWPECGCQNREETGERRTVCPHCGSEDPPNHKPGCTSALAAVMKKGINLSCW